MGELLLVHGKTLAGHCPEETTALAVRACEADAFDRSVDMINVFVDCPAALQAFLSDRVKHADRSVNDGKS